MPLIEARNVSRLFHRGTASEVRAIDEVTLTIDRSAFVALTGPSGSGKTTLLTLQAGLDQPTSGSMMLDGMDFAKCSDVERTRIRRRCGLIFTEVDFLRRLSLIDNISYALIPRLVARSERRASVAGLLDRLGLRQMERKRPDELSSGERQRANIARALAGQPEIVFADEPTSNLDRESAKSIIELFREIHAAGTTIIVATHDIELSAHATKIIRLDAGRLSES